MWKEFVETVREDADKLVLLFIGLMAVLLAERHPAISIALTISWVELRVQVAQVRRSP